MKIDITCFGVLAEVVGYEISVDLPVNSTVLQLKEIVLSTYPELSKYNFKIAQNKSFVSDLKTIDPSDEIVLLPPFAGG